MAESYVRVPTDSTGKKLRTVERTVGANVVHEELIQVVNPADGVAIDPRDSFSGADDVAKKALVDADRHPQVDVLSSALPSEAATEAKQDTGNTFLNNIDTKVGEVSATPTANTILARLKDLLTGIVLAAGTNVIGAVKTDIVNYTTIRKYVALTETAETAVWTPTAGKKFVITDIHISADAAGTCTLRDGTAGTTFMTFSFAANGGCVSNLRTPIESAAVDNVLTAQASAITQYILVTGYEI